MLFPTMAVQQQQHMDVVVCCTFFSRMISMFIFNILQFPSRYIQICMECIAPTCATRATGCISQKTIIFIFTFWRTSNLTSKHCPPLLHHIWGPCFVPIKDWHLSGWMQQQIILLYLGDITLSWLTGQASVTSTCGNFKSFLGEDG